MTHASGERSNEDQRDGSAAHLRLHLSYTGLFKVNRKFQFLLRVRERTFDSHM